MNLTPEIILALAPDSGSAANGRKLASPTRWQTLNAPAGMLWGEAQGSGQHPYLVGVDLNGLVSKCSCPSRKFPCKHALALMLLHTTHAGEFGQREAPESLRKWVAGRVQRAEGKERKSEGERQKEADPAAQAKRRAAREKKVTDGLAALGTFLKDLVRDGLAQASSRPYSDWDTQAARLVDAQAPGAARQVRRVPELLGDPAALLAHLAKLHLLCEAWTRRDTLSADQQADLRAALGFSLSQAEYQPDRSLEPDWVVMGSVQEDQDNLGVRRTWLHHGQMEQVAVLLEFGPPDRLPPPSVFQLERLHAQLHFAPGTRPQRATLPGNPGERHPVSIVPVRPQSIDALYAEWAAALAVNPWLERIGTHLGPVWLSIPPMSTPAAPETPYAYDPQGHQVKLSLTDEDLWFFLAYSAGEPLHLFGEWNGEHFQPLIGTRPSEPRWEDTAL